MSQNDLLTVCDDAVDLLAAGGTQCEHFLGEVARAQPFIEEFCKKFRVHLTQVDAEYINSRFKPVYAFSDGLGGYYVSALEDSLKRTKL